MPTYTVRELALDSNIFSTNEKLVDMDPVLQKEHPDVTPLLTVFNKLAADTAKNETIYWGNKEEIPTEITYAGASESSAPGAGAGTLDFTATYTYLRKDDVLHNPSTGESILITGTPTSDTKAVVPVYRGYGGTSYALTAGDPLIFGPGSKEEGADYVTARSIVQTEDYNYVQEFDEFAKLSTLADMESTHWGGPGSKFNQLVKDKQRAWALKMENGLWLGERAKTLLTGESGYRRSFKGINSWLATGTNIKNVNGVITESLFNTLLRKLYETYPDKTTVSLFCSPLVFGAIQTFARGKIQTSSNQTSYGLRVDRYVGDIDVDLIRCPLWKDTVRRGWAFPLDLERIKMKYMAHPRLEMDVQPKTANYRLSKYYTAMTLMFANEAAHAKWYGITG